MTTLRATFGTHAYPVHIGADLMDCVDLYVPHLQEASSIALVTNTTVEPLYARRLCETLAVFGKRLIQIVLPDGEAYKNWATLDAIFEPLLHARADRATTLIALGGGVVGDLTGFAAACYMRGVALIQIPTTLLAQVDASIGGKTGVNHRLGKNMIGAFYSPQMVLADVCVLRTLPERERCAGLAEVIKASAIADSAFFAWLEAHVDALLNGEEAVLSEAVRRACEIKVRIVRADERDRGLRALLNFGHTFGHAIETGLGHGAWLHGEAVGCGMALAADLSVRLGYLSEAARMRLVRLIQAARLPVRAPALGVDRYIDLMRSDKKASAGQIHCVVLKCLGEACLMPVSIRDLSLCLEANGASAARQHEHDANTF